MKILIAIAVVLVAQCASAEKSAQVAAHSTDPLTSLDKEVFDTTKSGEQKYKRALEELDTLLGAINQEIEAKTGAGAAVGGAGGHRAKREAYGWGGHEVSSSSYDHGHGWGGWSPPAHSYQVYHHHHGHGPRHHHNGGLTPEFLLKTALILKGILVLGHVAALG